MAEVKWIKIVTNIFDDEKILLIESLPNADSILVIWFKLLTLAGKQNNNGVFLIADRLPYTAEMLASIFHRKVGTVRAALQTFERFGMIEIVDDVITIPNWGKHQSLDQLDSKKEYMRAYMQEYRAKQKQLTDKTDGDAGCKDCKTNSKANVSSLDTEEEREEEKEREKSVYKPVIDYLNEKAGTSYRASTPRTQSLIRAREGEGFTLEDFKTVIDKKCAEWIGTEWEKFLRPETLFGTKFESYLNSKDRKGDDNAESGGADSSAAAQRVGTWL